MVTPWDFIHIQFELYTKLTVPCESTAKDVSFEKQHHRISSTDSKVRTTYSINTPM